MMTSIPHFQKIKYLRFFNIPHQINSNKWHKQINLKTEQMHSKILGPNIQIQARVSFLKRKYSSLDINIKDTT